jgi:hypothetical protein
LSSVFAPSEAIAAPIGTRAIASPEANGDVFSGQQLPRRFTGLLVRTRSAQNLSSKIDAIAPKNG